MGAMSLFTTKGRRRKKKRRIPGDAFYASEDASAKASMGASAKAGVETSAKKESDGKVLVKLDTKRTGKSISGSALMGKASLMVALGLVLLMGIGYLLTLLFSRNGTFTVKAQGLNDARKRIALSETIGFANPTAKLDSIGISSMDNITYDWLPLDELDAYDGAYNGENYIAYTFYVKNTGKDDLEYQSELYYTKATRGIENAARIMIYYNGEPTVYAAPSADGGTEIVPVGLTDFYDDTTVSSDVRSLAVDECDRYTVVVWLEGEDPECVDDVRSGTLQMEMDFNVLDDDGNPMDGDIEMARRSE
jgi:hypothetical protein